MTNSTIHIYDGNENIYDLEKYDIAKVDDVLVLVLQLKCEDIIYKFSTDERAHDYTYIESTIKKELSKAEAYLYEYNERSYITVGEEQFSGIRIDTIPRIQSM